MTALVAAAAARLDDRPDDPHAWRDAAVTAAVEDAIRRGDDDALLGLADAYSALVAVVPVATADGVRLVGAGVAERRRRGAFATPAPLAAVLARHALGDTRCGATVPRVVDPACGSGALLRAALDRLVTLGVPPARALDVLHGVDADPAAVAVCRAALVAAARRHGAAVDHGAADARIHVGDGLLGPTPHCPDGAGLVWHEAFPDVLAVDGGAVEAVTGWRGGFDAVLANPPWERLKVSHRDLAGAAESGLRQARAGQARAVREGGRHPLTGAGEVNAYLPFVETCWRLLAPDGRAGIVVPAGIAADRSAAALMAALLDGGSLQTLHLLEPPRAIFDGVSNRVGVAVVVLRGGPSARSGDVRPAQVAVALAAPDEDPGDRAWSLTPDLPALVNPNTATLPLFGSARDARIVADTYRRLPVLCRRARPARPGGGVAGGAVVEDPWQVRLVTPLHMTRDARHFRTAPADGLVPLWEAKHAGLLDHRGGAREQHRYWVPEDLVRERFGPLAARGWLGAYRNVTTTDSPRTLVPAPLPPVGVGNSLPLIDAPRLPLLLAALAALPVDYLVRQRHAGANLNFFKLEQVALPPPQAYLVPAPWQPDRTLERWVLERFADAVPFDAGLAALAAELAAAGVAVPDVPDPSGDRRRAALAELDAAHAVLLGWSRDDLAHVLTTFTALRTREERRTGTFGTARAVLDAYDRLTG